ncbi:MAG: zinc ribbon domain-containing protein, partial [Deltaproteobacteria bacterium]|nr:zinc ribbon domain-containing protein [Deltaproteobacteria bacterium]
MGVIECPRCGEEISDQAKSCPHCGFSVGVARLGRYLERRQ